MYDEVRRGAIDDEKFSDIVLSQLQIIKSEEELRGGILDIPQIPYATDISVLPFLLFKPEGAVVGCAVIVVRWWVTSLKHRRTRDRSRRY